MLNLRKCLWPSLHHAHPLVWMFDTGNWEDVGTDQDPDGTGMACDKHQRWDFCSTEKNCILSPWITLKMLCNYGPGHATQTWRHGCIASFEHLSFFQFQKRIYRSFHSPGSFSHQFEVEVPHFVFLVGRKVSLSGLFGVYGWMYSKNRYFMVFASFYIKHYRINSKKISVQHELHIHLHCKKETYEDWHLSKEFSRWMIPAITSARTQDIKAKITLNHSFTVWWSHIFDIFTPIWGRFPIWLIFFGWVETNQIEHSYGNRGGSNENVRQQLRQKWPSNKHKRPEEC